MFLNNSNAKCLQNVLIDAPDLSNLNPKLSHGIGTIHLQFCKTSLPRNFTILSHSLILSPEQPPKGIIIHNPLSESNLRHHALHPLIWVVIVQTLLIGRGQPRIAKLQLGVVLLKLI